MTNKEMRWAKAALVTAILCGTTLTVAAQDLPWDRVRLISSVRQNCRIVNSHRDLASLLRTKLKPTYPTVNWTEDRVLVITPGNITPTFANLEQGLIRVTATSWADDTGAVIIVVPATYREATGCALDRSGEPPLSYSWSASVAGALSADETKTVESRPPLPKDEKHSVAAHPGLGTQ